MPRGVVVGSRAQGEEGCGLPGVAGVVPRPREGTQLPSRTPCPAAFLITEFCFDLITR